jgi:hypothetical protein
MSGEDVSFALAEIEQLKQEIERLQLELTAAKLLSIEWIYQKRNEQKEAVHAEFAKSVKRLDLSIIDGHVALFVFQPTYPENQVKCAPDKKHHVSQLVHKESMNPKESDIL